MDLEETVYCKTRPTALTKKPFLLIGSEDISDRILQNENFPSSKKNLKDHFLWKGFNCVKGVNNYKFYARNFKSLTATVIKNQNNLIPPGIRHNESNDAKKQIKSYKKHLLI